MNNSLKVNFIEIDKSIQNINNNLNEIDAIIDDLNKLIISVDEGWNDTLFKSSENYKTSLKLNIVDKMVANNLLVRSLMESVNTAMTIYKENESKWQGTINVINL